jgi:imidazolonepropionase-like amidohydrolase
MRKSLLALLVLGLIGGLAVDSSAQLNSGAQQNVQGRAGTFAIKGARVVTVSGPAIENGTVVIRDGKIAAVGGAEVSVPSGAEVIDGKGLSVFPGMIDAGTSMGLMEIPLGAPGTNDLSELGDMNANAKAITAVNPHNAHINMTRVNGITSVLTMPRDGLVAGQSAVINLLGATAGDMAVTPQFALVINFPRISLFDGFNPFTGPQQVDFNEAVRRRDRRLEDLKKIFKDVMNYGRLQDAFAKDPSLPRPATNIKMGDMLPFARGEKPIIFTAERERDIRAVVKFAEEMKVKAIILGGQDAAKAATLLKEKDIPVIYTHVQSLPVQQDNAYDSLYEVPAMLQKAGVRFCISTSDTGANVRDLPYHAGMAGAYGLSPAEALRSVTLSAAQILGAGDRLGSLEVGKIANVVVADGDILEARTNIKHLFINGRSVPLTSRQTELYDQFKDRK